MEMLILERSTEQITAISVIAYIHQPAIEVARLDANHSILYTILFWCFWSYLTTFIDTKLFFQKQDFCQWINHMEIKLLY